MTTKHEQVLSAIDTTLDGTAGAGVRVYRSRVDPLSRAESGAIVIRPGRRIPSAVSNCKTDWKSEVFIDVYARGLIPDQVADPIIEDMHRRLMANRSLGGLAMDIEPGPVHPEFEKADLPAVWMVHLYIVTYRTNVEDLST